MYKDTINLVFVKKMINYQKEKDLLKFMNKMERIIVHG